MSLEKNKEDKLSNLNFDKFRALARDNSLSMYEKIGFYDKFREGKEKVIFEDILTKLKNLSGNGKTVIDIGCGCSELPVMLIELCRIKGHHLILIDSKEMLDQLPDAEFITKMPAQYPKDCEELFKNFSGKADAILIYSVLHYIVEEINLMEFLDKTMSLLSDKGEILIGDIPNVSKRNRFFSSKSGIEFHQQNNNTEDLPEVKFNSLENNQIDDAMLFFILARCRNSGFDSYLCQQDASLPMANRRDDILIVKP